jgi:hypothetical protein
MLYYAYTDAASTGQRDVWRGAGQGRAVRWLLLTLAVAVLPGRLASLLKARRSLHSCVYARCNADPLKPAVLVLVLVLF